MPYEISVTLPLSQALDRTKRILFEPFDLRKWLIIGFCAWLATLGENGIRGGYNQRFGSGQGNPASTAREWYEQIRHFVVPNLWWIVPVGIGLAILVLALWLAFVWLSSRGQFMFLHCVALDRAEVTVPWHKYSREGNSLFLFRLLTGLAAMVLLTPAALGVIWLIVGMVTHGAPTVEGILGTILLAMFVVLVWPVWWMVARLTRDFVVPIQFARNLRCLDAWRILLSLLSVNIANLIIYFLFQIALGMAIFVAVLFVVLVTCCIAGCILAIPFVGTVIYLPILVLQRSYSLYYLAQFGPEWNVLTNL